MPIQCQGFKYWNRRMMGSEILLNEIMLNWTEPWCLQIEIVMFRDEARAIPEMV